MEYQQSSNDIVESKFMQRDCGHRSKILSCKYLSDKKNLYVLILDKQFDKNTLEIIGTLESYRKRPICEVIPSKTTVKTTHWSTNCTVVPKRCVLKKHVLNNGLKKTSSTICFIYSIMYLAVMQF